MSQRQGSAHNLPSSETLWSPSAVVLSTSAFLVFAYLFHRHFLASLLLSYRENMARKKSAELLLSQQSNPSHTDSRANNMAGTPQQSSSHKSPHKSKKKLQGQQNGLGTANAAKNDAPVSSTHVPNNARPEKQSKKSNSSKKKGHNSHQRGSSHSRASTKTTAPTPATRSYGVQATPALSDHSIQAQSFLSGASTSTSEVDPEDSHSQHNSTAELTLKSSRVPFAPLHHRENTLTRSNVEAFARSNHGQRHSISSLISPQTAKLQQNASSSGASRRLASASSSSASSVMSASDNSSTGVFSPQSMSSSLSNHFPTQSFALTSVQNAPQRPPSAISDAFSDKQSSTTSSHHYNNSRKAAMPDFLKSDAFGKRRQSIMSDQEGHGRHFESERTKTAEVMAPRSFDNHSRAPRQPTEAYDWSRQQTQHEEDSNYTGSSKGLVQPHGGGTSVRKQVMPGHLHLSAPQSAQMAYMSPSLPLSASQRGVGQSPSMSNYAQFEDISGYQSLTEGAIIRNRRSRHDNQRQVAATHSETLPAYIQAHQQYAAIQQQQALLQQQQQLLLFAQHQSQQQQQQHQQQQQQQQQIYEYAEGNGVGAFIANPFFNLGPAIDTSVAQMSPTQHVRSQRKPPPPALTISAGPTGSANLDTPPLSCRAHSSSKANNFNNAVSPLASSLQGQTAGAHLAVSSIPSRPASRSNSIGSVDSPASLARSRPASSKPIDAPQTQAGPPDEKQALEQTVALLQQKLCQAEVTNVRMAQEAEEATWRASVVDDYMVQLTHADAEKEERIRELEVRLGIRSGSSDGDSNEPSVASLPMNEVRCGAFMRSRRGSISPHPSVRVLFLISLTFFFN